MSFQRSPLNSRSLGSSFLFFSLQKPRGVGKGDKEVVQIGNIFFSRIFFFRALVSLFLIVTTVLVSTFAWITINDLQQELYESQFESYAGQALDNAESAVQRSSMEAKAVAMQMANAFPDAAQWPFVALNGYEDIAEAISAVSFGKGTAFAPLVRSPDLAQFNVFMNNYFASEPNIIPSPLGFRPVVGARVDPATGELIYHVESTGETWWGSPYNEMFPVLQSRNYSDPFTNLLLSFNMHSLPPYGPALDKLMDCVAAASIEDLEARRVQCGIMSNIISEVIDDVNNAIFQPIFPSNNRTTLVGVSLTGMNWINVLTGVVPTSIGGIDFVVTNPSNRVPAITYTIIDGVPSQRGVGDLHDREFSQYGRSRTLSLEDSLSPTSNLYTITVYPRSEFIAIYTTDLPRNSTIAAVLLIFLTSLAFFMYDRVMKRDSNEKEDLLQTKRQFVRFISHEVRTPLNAVSMGLKLLENELQEAMDDDIDREDDEEGEKRMDALKRESSFTASQERARERRRLQIEDWKQLAIDITENTSSAVFVLDDLLNYDKIETGSLRLELKEVDIWELLRKTVHTFELAAKQVKVSLVLNIEKGFEQANHSIKAAPAVGGASFYHKFNMRNASGTRLRDFVGISRSASSGSVETGVETRARVGPSPLRIGSSSASCSIVPEVLLQPSATKATIPIGRDAQCRLADIESGGQALVGIGAAEEAEEKEEEEAGMTSRHALQPIKPLSMKPHPLQNIQAIYPPEAGHVHVLGDGTRLAQVMRNLISNALKFTPEDGRITIAAQWTPNGLPSAAPREMIAHAYDILYPRAGSIRISVSDTGAGLSEDQLARICSEGVQFNANALQGGRGSGLGLFISKGIVEQHGGTMVVTSEGLGHGTTFTVELPLYLFPRDETVATAASAGGTRGGGSENDEDNDDDYTPDCVSDEHETDSSRRMSAARTDSMHGISHRQRSSLMTEETLPHAFSDLRSISTSSAEERICSVRMHGKASSSEAQQQPYSPLRQETETAARARQQQKQEQEQEQSGVGPNTQRGGGREASANDDSQSNQGSGNLGTMAAPAFPRRVLVVDDAASNRKMLLRLLQRRGCECVEARNGQEALDIYKKTTEHFRDHNFIRSISALSSIAATNHQRRSSAGLMETSSGVDVSGSVAVAVENQEASTSLSRKEVKTMAVGRQLQEEKDKHKDKDKDKRERNDSSTYPSSYSSAAAVVAVPPPMEDFDAIFMDFEMPILNGPDATKLIRQVGCHCMIIGITGNVLPADMKHFVEQGADIVLPKPLKLEDVTRAWREYSEGNLLAMSSNAAKPRKPKSKQLK